MKMEYILYVGLAIIIGFVMFTNIGCGKEKFPGTKSEYLGYDRYDFTLEGRDCIIVCPHEPVKGKYWIWRARFFEHFPQVDKEMLARGFYLVYIDVADMFGSPKAVAVWDMYYDYLVNQHNFAKKTVLEGLSRGGLIIYNWAIKNPEKVYCLYGDAPVCDLKSWPGVKRQEMLDAYGFTEQEALEYTGNPVDNLEPLARAGVPILHVVGDADKTVSVAENTAIVEERYNALGGKIKVIHKPGVGHHPHSLEDPAPIVEYILDCVGIE